MRQHLARMVPPSVAALGGIGRRTMLKTARQPGEPPSGPGALPAQDRYASQVVKAARYRVGVLSGPCPESPLRPTK